MADISPCAFSSYSVGITIFTFHYHSTKPKYACVHILLLFFFFFVFFAQIFRMPRMTLNGNLRNYLSFSMSFEFTLHRFPLLFYIFHFSSLINVQIICKNKTLLRPIIKLWLMCNFNYYINHHNCNTNATNSRFYFQWYVLFGVFCPVCTCSSFVHKVAVFLQFFFALSCVLFCSVFGGKMNQQKIIIECTPAGIIWRVYISGNHKTYIITKIICTSCAFMLCTLFCSVLFLSLSDPLASPRVCVRGFLALTLDVSLYRCIVSPSLYLLRYGWLS